MGFLKKIFQVIFGKNLRKKQKTFFGKKLIIEVGQTSADDEDGDRSAGYEVKEGKIQIKNLRKRRWKSKDGADFEIWDSLEIQPKTRIAVIKYQVHRHLDTQTYRIRLFKYWKENKGVIKL